MSRISQRFVRERRATPGSIALCRRTGLVALLREDVQVEANRFGTVAIRRSKADQEGRGNVAVYLQAWIHSSPERDGFTVSQRRGGRTAAGSD